MSNTTYKAAKAEALAIYNAAVDAIGETRVLDHRNARAAFTTVDAYRLQVAIADKACRDAFEAASKAYLDTLQVARNECRAAKAA